MKIKLLRNYSTYSAGAIVDCEDGTAHRLIRDGIAAREQQLDLIETASVDPISERADATPRRVTRRAVSKSESSDAASG